MRWSTDSPPPVWLFALPAAVALGILVGTMFAEPEPSPPPAPALALAPPAQPPAKAAIPASPTATLDAPTVEPVVAFEPDPGGLDGGEYEPLGGPVLEGDTLPAAPDGPGGPPSAAGLASRLEPAAASAPPPPTLPSAPPRDSEPHRAPPVAKAVPRGGPANRMGRESALAHPLLAVVRGGRTVSFYSAWDAPPRRVDLPGEWAAPRHCSKPVRLRYEQPAPELGSVRGVGEVVSQAGWTLELVVPRQHCAAAGGRLRSPRPPRGDEAALLTPLLGGETPVAVVADGSRLWAASAHNAVLAHRTGTSVTATWTDQAPSGSTMRFIGTWSGDGIWAVVSGARLSHVWRIGAGG